MVENQCECGAKFEDIRQRPFCPECIAKRRIAKKLIAAEGRIPPRLRRHKRLRILTRDDWVCAICLLPIPKKAKMGDLLYGNVDHIIPVSKNGLNDDQNYQSTHALCNTIKANQEDTAFKEAMRDILQEIVKSVKPVKE